MTTNQPEATEGLIRVRANRRGTPVELKVHYQVRRVQGCTTYQILRVEDSD